MPPVDSTPNINTGNFELLYSLKSNDRIPVSEFKSRKTGLTVVIAEVEGPVVNGFFCLVTEAFDDDGLPHTLEHLIFLGSEQFPYKGVLDLLANRCLASGTNAWTDIDHTCYTMETAGSEGFLSLMPIFLDHILYPVLSDEGFVTEVHHITGDGYDAGVVYCEMQGRENSAESRLHLTMNRKMYPGKCGYSSETGGIMKNLRESCNNTKVKDYHKQFYRPENLKLIITGQIKPEDVFKALIPLEEKILSKGPRGPFTRPWQSPVPPLSQSEDLVIKYPSDDESNGIFSIAWRGPSAVTEFYDLSALTMLMQYLTAYSVSPLPKEFVEIEDPYASQIFHSLNENSISCPYLIFQSVPTAKLPLIKPKLDETLKKIHDEKDINMEQLHNIINRRKLETLSSIENSPHHTITYMIIGHMLYGNTKEDLKQRVNPVDDLNKMTKEPQEYWLNILNKYLIRNKHISIQCFPSSDEQKVMANEERDRIAKQVQELGVDGLKIKEKTLENSVTFNDRPIPENMLTSVPVPNVNNVKFHSIQRYRSDLDERKYIDLSETHLYTFFDHVKTNFVYMSALLDTSSLTPYLRNYLPLLLDTILESPIKRGDQIIPHEQVIIELNNDTVMNMARIGFKSGRFTCGPFSNTAVLLLQTESSNYEKGINWLRELLYQPVLTVEKIRIIVNKMINDVAQAKRQESSVVNYVMKYLRYINDSNVQANGIINQHKFLLRVLEELDSNPNAIIEKMEQLREIITSPDNVALHFAGNLELLKADAVKAIKNFLPANTNTITAQKKLNVVPDWKLLKDKPLQSCVIGLGCTESSCLYQTIGCINDYNDPDVPALLLFLQYLTQAEGPMWRQIRGKGYSYNYRILTKINEGLLYLVFAKATNVVGAYKEARDIVNKQIEEQIWDPALLEAARSSLIFDLIDEEKTVGNVVMLSLTSYFEGVDYFYKRSMLSLIANVTVEDLNRVGRTYVKPLFDPAKAVTAIVCDPAKVDEIKAAFEAFNQPLHPYYSLEESIVSK